MCGYDTVLGIFSDQWRVSEACWAGHWRGGRRGDKPSVSDRLRGGPAGVRCRVGAGVSSQQDPKQVSICWWCHKNVVFQDKWSLVKGLLASKWRTSCQEYLVFQDSWSLMAVVSQERFHRMVVYVRHVICFRLVQRGQSLEQFDYNNKGIMYEIKQAMTDTNFLGVSVRILQLSRIYCTIFIIKL